eukprot:1321306-Rhodomonas_salina.3
MESGETCAAAVLGPASCIWIMSISFGLENATWPRPDRLPITSSKPTGSLPCASWCFEVALRSAWFMPIMIAFSGATPISAPFSPLYSPATPSPRIVLENVGKNPRTFSAVAACILIFVDSAGYRAAVPEAPPIAPNTKPSACFANRWSFSC